MAIVMRMRDHCTRSGAATLAERIRAYWARHGVNVQVWTEETADMWVVRSDLISGRPRIGKGRA